MLKRWLIIFVFIFLVGFISATEIYVSNSSSRNSFPCDIGTPCTLNFANSNVQAGDTVYLRGGTYYPTDRSNCIHPERSGNSTHRITYKNYNGESVIIDGTNSNYEGLLLSAGYSGGGSIEGRDYITINGITFRNWNEFGNLYYADYNEISNCTFTGQKGGSEGLNAANYDAFEITYNSTHNYIHDNSWHTYGQYTTGDFGVLLGIGNEAEEGDECGYNTVENNHFYHAGHEVLGVHSGKYNVVRNNYVHNEGWWNGSAFCQAQENGVCGYRVFSMSNNNIDTSGNTLVENNLIAYGAQYGGPHPTTGGSGSGLTVATSYNIVRYNEIFGNAMFGARFASSNSGSRFSHFYSNTLYSNGYGADDDIYAIDVLRMALSLYEDTCPEVENNVVKNNLAHESWAETNNKTNTVYYPAFYTSNIENCNPVENNYGTTGGFEDRKSIPFTPYPDPLFVDTDISDPMALTLVDGKWVGNPDLSLQSSSPAIDNGTYLTLVNSSDSGIGTTLIVDDALYFQDGSWGSDLARSNLHSDWIAVGTVDNVVQISSIDYDTNTITLASPITWNDNDPVWLYKKSDGERVLYGDAPDQGAYEYISQPEVIHAATCNQSDVQAAIDSADYGDTVLVPAGSCVWRNGINITKDLVIKGSGIDSTNLTMNFSDDSQYEGFFNFKPDGIAKGRLRQDSSPTGMIDVSGFSFMGNNRITYKYGIWIYNYDILITRVRIHQNTFSNIHRAVHTNGEIYGVFYNNTLEDTNANYPNADNGYSWNTYPAIAGEGDGWYIENNRFSFSGPGALSGGGHGMSHVIRYNTVIGSITGIYVDSHGNQQSGIKGTQLTEIYGNNLSATANQGIDMRGGKAFVFFNIFNDDSMQVREEYADNYSGTPINNACPSDKPQICSAECKCMKIHDSYFINNRRLNGNLEPAEISYDRYDNVNPNIPPELVENREFFNHNTTFDGLLGIGCGPLSSIPTTCTAGVGYWASEQNCNGINQINVGINPYEPINGTLYKCTSTNTWEEYYQPYIYPHPLTVAPFGTTICGEGEITSECWCEGLRTSGSCEHGYYLSSLYHNADANKNKIIEREELDTYIAEWKSNSGISLSDMIETIGKWKAGGY